MSCDGAFSCSNAQLVSGSSFLGCTALGSCFNVEEIYGEHEIDCEGESSCKNSNIISAMLSPRVATAALIPSDKICMAQAHCLCQIQQLLFNTMTKRLITLPTSIFMDIMLDIIQNLYVERIMLVILNVVEMDIDVII